jgi:hypothetical protein
VISPVTLALPHLKSQALFLKPTAMALKGQRIADRKKMEIIFKDNALPGRKPAQ